MKEKKTLFFGPYPAPYTGQSISFKQVYDNFNDNKVLFNTTRFNSNKLVNSIYCLFFLPIVFLCNRFDKVYFTCSRSKLGFIKDLQLIILSKIFSKKLINHLHGADLSSFYKNAGNLKKIIRWCYKQININIVLLPEMKDQFSDFKTKKIEVVENCYSILDQESKINISFKNKQILYLSNLLYSKGIFVFLDAIKQVLKSREDIIVKIAGLPMTDSYMTDKEVLIKFNEESGLLKKRYPERFFYLGIVKGMQKEDLLKESSIFVLPTFYKTEAFPLTIIEAMYFGNAIITTKHNYLPNIINKNNGQLVDVKSSEQLIKSIYYLFEDENKLNAIQNYNINESRKKYNPETFNKKINAIIKNA